MENECIYSKYFLNLFLLTEREIERDLCEKYHCSKACRSTKHDTVNLLILWNYEKNVNLGVEIVWCINF